MGVHLACEGTVLIGKITKQSILANPGTFSLNPLCQRDYYDKDHSITALIPRLMTDSSLATDWMIVREDNISNNSKLTPISS